MDMQTVFGVDMIMGSLRLVGFLKLQASLAKKPYKRDNTWMEMQTVLGVDMIIKEDPLWDGSVLHECEE